VTAGVTSPWGDVRVLAADFQKIVRTDTLHQQETGIGFGTVGNQMGGFRCYVKGIADGELAAVGRSPVPIDSVPSSTKYRRGRNGSSCP